MSIFCFCSTAFGMDPSKQPDTNKQVAKIITAQQSQPCSCGAWHCRTNERLLAKKDETVTEKKVRTSTNASYGGSWHSRSNYK